MGLIIISFFSSILSAMGIGGGTIYIAVATLVQAQSQQVVQLQNLIIFMFAALIASIKNIHEKIFDRKLFIKLISFGIIGSFIGAILANNIAEENLKKYFYVFMLFVGLYEIISSIILKKSGKLNIAKNDENA